MVKAKTPYERTRQNYDEGTKWHTEKFAKYDWSKQIDRFTQALNGPQVLDAGCGSGRDIKEFLAREMEVEGLDYSAQSVEECRARFKDVLFHEGNLMQMKLADQSYDGVWACASVLNLKKEDVPRALAEFKRVLKRNGLLYLSVKEGEGEGLIPDQGGERFFSFYSRDEIISMVETSGFEILHDERVTDAEATGVESNDKPAWICLYASPE